LLGRAKDISEFVKHGSDKGWIEIVLCNKNGSNVTIKRNINKNNNHSIWKINGKYSLAISGATNAARAAVFLSPNGCADSIY
jgi:hypothetical protein